MPKSLRNNCSRLIFYILGFTLIMANPEIAGAGKPGVMISPHRVILEGRNRTAQIRIVNPGDEPLQFRIGLVHMEMDSEGRLLIVKEPTEAQKKVEKMIRFSPRRTYLNPAEAQTIRIMARRAAGVADGEYRVHLSLVPVPLPPSGGAPKVKKVENKTTFDINMLIGVTLPIFIRYGDLTADVTPLRLQLQEGASPFVNLDLGRTGNRTVTTDVDLFLVSPDGGGEEKVGAVAGAAVYYPAALRTVKIPLSVPADFRFEGRDLKVVIRDHEDTKRPVLSSKIFSLRNP